MEGLGELLCYASPDERLTFFQRVTYNYVSAAYVEIPDIFIKMKRTIQYLKLSPTEYRCEEGIMYVYQSNDMLWKFAFMESEKELGFALLVEYSQQSHVIIENAINNFIKN